MQIKELEEKIQMVSDRYVKEFGINTDQDWYVFKLQEELGELTQKYLMMTKRARNKGLTDQEIRRGFEEEVADVFCHLLLMAKNNNIDLEKVVSEKWLKYL